LPLFVSPLRIFATPKWRPILSEAKYKRSFAGPVKITGLFLKPKTDEVRGKNDIFFLKMLFFHSPVILKGA